MRYLLNKGVDPKRLSSNGFGLTKPVADNNTAEGRALNRRVEFKILEEDDPNKPKKPEGKSEEGGDKGGKTKEPTAEPSGEKSKSAPRSQGDAKSAAPANR